MKKLMILILIFASHPMIASVNCLDNSKHLSEDFDDKEWHSVACDCPCTIVKGNKCIECGHLQNARTYVVVLPTKIAQQAKIHAPQDPQAVIKKLALKYVQKK
jgi:hypothetical protein